MPSSLFLILMPFSLVLILSLSKDALPFCSAAPDAALKSRKIRTPAPSDTPPAAD
jgi:hypothetical protein